MFASNVPPLERLARILFGLCLLAFAVYALPQPSLILAATGLFIVATGLAGFCPACALAGRRPRPRG